MLQTKILLVLYIVKKSQNFLDGKNVEIRKRSHTYKGYWSTYYVEILNSFNHELQLEDTKIIIKNKLIDLLSKLIGFKFVAILVLVF